MCRPIVRSFGDDKKWPKCYIPIRPHREVLYSDYEFAILTGSDVLTTDGSQTPFYLMGGLAVQLILFSSQMQRVLKVSNF